MNNKTNYPKWVSKLQRQLKQKKSEVAELQNCVLHWVEKATERKEMIDALRIECEMYKASSKRFYELLGSKDKSTDQLLSLLEKLTAANTDLKKQLRECQKQQCIAVEK